MFRVPSDLRCSRRRRFPKRAPRRPTSVPQPRDYVVAGIADKGRHGDRASSKRASFKLVSEQRSHCPFSLFSTSFSDILCALTTFHLPAPSNFRVKRKSPPKPSSLLSSRSAKEACTTNLPGSLHRSGSTVHQRNRSEVFLDNASLFS